MKFVNCGILFIALLCSNASNAAHQPLIEDGDDVAITKQKQENPSEDFATLIDQVKLKLQSLREVLKSEVGEDSNYDKAGYFPKFSNFNGLASQNKTEETSLKALRVQLRDLFTRGNQDSMYSKFTENDIKLLKLLKNAYGESKFQGGMFNPWGLTPTKKQTRQTSHGLIEESIGLISKLIEEKDLVESKQTIVVDGCVISTKFLDDNLEGPTANKILKKEQQIYLIVKGYQLLNQIKTGDLTPSPSTVIFSPEFLSSQSGWISSGLKTVSKLSKLGQSTVDKKTLLRRAYLEDIVAIVWALINESYVSENFFKNGSFKIVDDNKYLYKFFVEYIKFAGSVDDLSQIAMANFNMASINKGAYFVYDRTKFSTHYKNETIHQTGVDVRFESTEYPLPALPNNMTHLILGLINFKNKEYIFLKPEDHGLGDWYNAAIHGLGQVPGFTSAPKGFSEKIIPESLFGAFQNFVNELPEEELEALGQEGASAVKIIYNFTQSQKIPTGQELPISTMFGLLQKALTNAEIGLGEDLPEENPLYSLQEKARLFAQELIKFKDFDIRSGNEIIVNLMKIDRGRL